MILLFAVSVTAQVNDLNKSKTVLVNEPVEFTVSSFFPPAVKSRDEEGTINIMPHGSGTYKITYTPETDYIGTMDFVLECNPVVFPPAPEYVTFSINYIKSYVKAENDYAWYSGEDMIFEPMLNDSSSVDALSIRSISQVVHGNASIQNDNEILYTGADNVNLDYIVYNVIDTNGVYDVATIFVSYPQETLEASKTKEVRIAKGDDYIILLDAQDYLLTGASVMGSVYQKAAHAYAYKSSSIGVDTLTFTTAERTRTYIIHTIEADEDEGIVKDDLFYGAVGNPRTFNVFDNDQSAQFFIQDYSDELTYNGNGEFTYTPGPNEQGLKFFYYTVNTGTATETGTIRLILNNFAPENDFTYELSTEAGKELVINYDVPLDSYYFNVAANPNFGTLEIFDQGDIALTCNTLYADNSIVYTPLDGFQGIDEFDVEYCPSGAGGCSIIKVRVDVGASSDDCPCVNDCVWSGDANNDGKVNMLDILTIGRNIGAAGEARNTTDWGASSAIDFEDVLPLDRNSKYADANGDGTVGISDMNVVRTNFGKYHRLISKDALGVIGVPLYYSSTTTTIGEDQYVTLNFYLGSEGLPAIDMEGVAFELEFNADDIDSSSVSLTVSKDSYFVEESPYLAELMQPTAGNIQVGIIKTNRVASTGFGQIATLEFIIEDEAIGIKPEFRREDKSFDISIVNAHVVNNEGYLFELKDYASSVRIDTEEEGEALSYLNIAPNPAYDIIQVSADQDIDFIQVYDLAGNAVLQSRSTSLDVSSLAAGLYVLQAQSNQVVLTEKLEVIR